MDGAGARDDGRRAQIQQQLWELAQDVSRYLRRHASPAVRLATALLLAASLAACDASASDTTAVQTRAVAPLAQEVASGLPRGPGIYPVVPGSVFRDQRGVYQFEWLGPGQTTGPGQVAHVSRLRLVRDDTLALELAQGADPILHLKAGEDVGLIQQAQVGQAQPGPQYYPRPYSYWDPFLTGALVSSLRPAYYDPPRTVVVAQPPGETERRDGSGSSGGGVTGGARSATRVEGGTVSESARPPSQRVTGIQTAVSGRAGGTGAGSAVTSRNVASGASSAASGARSAGSASSGSSGVSAPRSGGFSSGVGSSGGSAAS